MSEEQVAKRLHEVFAVFDKEPAIRRLRVRLRDLGRNANDEVAQFRLLQKACRESDELAAALGGLDYIGIPEVNPRKPDAKSGELIQGFNRMIEDYWELF